MLFAICSCWNDFSCCVIRSQKSRIECSNVVVVDFFWTVRTIWHLDDSEMKVCDFDWWMDGFCACGDREGDALLFWMRMELEFLFLTCFSMNNRKKRTLTTTRALVVQWQDICLPSRRLGFDSRQAHLFFSFVTYEICQRLQHHHHSIENEKKRRKWSGHTTTTQPTPLLPTPT